MNLPKSLQTAINEFAKLPGIGQKSAQRIALSLLKKNQIDISALSRAVEEVKSTVNFCSICHTMADLDPCSICTDSTRNQSLICVVEEPLDALAIEKSRGFLGLYHVLGGVLSPLDGIGPDKLQIQSLLSRLTAHGSSLINEVILATNPTLEGETTARHIAKLIAEANPQIKITRIARGIPTGGDLEYADDLTLTRAMEGRREF